MSAANLQPISTSIFARLKYQKFANFNWNLHHHFYLVIKSCLWSIVCSNFDDFKMNLNRSICLLRADCKLFVKQVTRMSHAREMNHGPLRIACYSAFSCLWTAGLSPHFFVVLSWDLDENYSEIRHGSLYSTNYSTISTISKMGS